MKNIFHKITFNIDGAINNKLMTRGPPGPLPFLFFKFLTMIVKIPYSTWAGIRNPQKPSE